MKRNLQKRLLALLLILTLLPAAPAAAAEGSGTVGKAHLHDTSEITGDDGLYTDYTATPGDDAEHNGWIAVTLTVKNLKFHRNANNDWGYWAGFSVLAPDGATRYKMAASLSAETIVTKELGGVTECDPNVDGEDDGHAGFAIYTDLALTNQREYYVKLQWSDENGTPLENYETPVTYHVKVDSSSTLVPNVTVSGNATAAIPTEGWPAVTDCNTDAAFVVPSSGGKLTLTPSADYQITGVTATNAEYTYDAATDTDAAAVTFSSITGASALTVSTKAPVTGVTLSASTLSVDVGGTGTLTAAVAPSVATDPSVTWSSSDTAIAAVDENGVVTGVAAGTATITVATTDGGHTAECAVTVTPVAVTSVTLNTTALSLNVGGKEVLTATVAPENATDKTVTWKSSNEAVATVTGGTVVAVGGGSATVTATAGGVSASCAVTVIRPATGVSLSASTLSVDVGGTGTLTAAVAPADATNKTVVWSSSDTAVATVSGGTVTGVKAGSATITATTADGGYTASCTVTVSNVDPTGVSLSAETLTMTAGSAATLAATVSPANATDKTVNWSVASGSNVSLSAKTTQSGGAIVVTATGTGTAVVTVTTAGDSPKSATCTITVSSARINAYLSSGTLSFATLTDELGTICRNITGASVSYLTNLSVSTSEGTLYEGYASEGDPGEGVSSALKYYNSSSGARRLGNLTFVPKPGFSGAAAIGFICYAVNGELFTGSIVVNVRVSDVSLSYASDDGEPVRFLASDFTDYARTLGYNAIRYVRFDLPSPRYGALYYNYSDGEINGGAVDETTLYYRASAPYLDRVWFVPAANFSGIARVYFTARDTAGNTFTGSVLIYVADVGGGGDYVVSYDVAAGGTVYFDVNDFNDLSYEETYYALSYLSFTALPSAGRGTLYYGGDAVTAGQTFYRTGSNRRLLSGVSFTAASGYTGTVMIPFSAVAGSGDAFTGTVAITVASSGSPGSEMGAGGMIIYASAGGAAAFDSRDFYDDASRSLSYTLASVRFHTPDAAAGKLCLNYLSPTSYTVLDTGAEYSPEILSRVSFLPRAGFRGTAYVRYVGTDQTGKSYAGTLAIVVAPPAASSYFDDLGDYAWAVPSADFLARYGIVSGTAYRTYTPAGLTRRGDFVLMLDRCFGFGGGGGGAAPFDDVPAGSYYASAIAAARASGIVAGDGDGNFRPNDPLTRQEAAVLLCRCLSLPGGTEADLLGFSDRASIAPYAVASMAALAQRGVLEGDGGRLNPTAPLTRAEMASLFHKALT